MWHDTATMLEQIIRDFPKQFEFEPVVENVDKLGSFSKFVCCAMGGSNHATDLLRSWKASVDVLVHRDYGLTGISDTSDRLIICNSYSGNTEEPIDGFEVARVQGLPLAAIATGGSLLEIAQTAGVPYIQIPPTRIPPRSSLGYMFMALLKLMGDEADLKQARTLSTTLQPEAFEPLGQQLADKLLNTVPVIYASHRNWAIVNNWKIKFNENTKIPAFMNTFPELNHNEMNAFDKTETTEALRRPFHFVFLTDDEDDPRIQRRMAVTADLYRQRGLSVEMVPITGQSRLEKMFNSLLLADWVTCILARRYGFDPEPVPMVEEFKKLIV